MLSPFASSTKAFPVLQTDRLVLRQLAENDAADYFRQVSALPRTSSWPYSYEAQSEEKCRLAINSYNNHFKRSKTIIPWVVAIRGSGELIGFVKLFDIAARSRGEIGYWIGQSHWNHGFGTEAVTAVVSFAFGPLGMHRLYAMTDKANAPSQRLLERIGFVLEGTLRQHAVRGGEWRDSLLYGMLSEDLRTGQR